MGQPGMPGSQFPGEDALVRRVQDLERAVQQLAAADAFGLTGLTPREGGTDFDGFVNVNGPMKITGTLDLPAGIIGNAALQSPASFGSASSKATNFPLTTTGGTVASGTITVPAGYTQALVFVVVSVGVVNPGTVDDFVYARASINGVLSNESFGYISPNNGSVEAVSAKSSILTGLSGGSITVGIDARTKTNNFTADGANRAYVDAQAVFLR